MNYWKKIGASALALGAIASIAYWMDSGRSLHVMAKSPQVLLGQSEMLEQECQAADHRVVVNANIVKAIAENRETLSAAVAEFVDLHRGLPVFELQYQDIHPGATVEERVARDLANRAYRHIEDRAKQEALVHRLASEFHQMFPSSEPVEFTPASATQPPVYFHSPLEHREFPMPLPPVAME
jgi:hypothetical protein